MTQLFSIVAYDRNRGIGFQGKIPWNLRHDMEHFKKTTEGHIVIMGRGTWDSLPKKPLPGRYNIVITSRPSEGNGDLYYQCGNPKDALATARDIQKVNPGKRIFIIGGGRIYDAYTDLITDQICTRLPAVYQADTFYPVLPGKWEKVEHLSYVFQGTQFNHYRKK